MRVRRNRGSRTVAWLAGAALVGGLIAGCGEVKNTITPDPGSANHVTVMLSGRPNGFDVGLYEAQKLGFFAQTDLHVRIETPGPGEDPLQLLHDGKVRVAIASAPTVLLHRSEDQPLVGIAALVDVPLPLITITTPGNSAPSGGSGVTGTTTTPAGITTSTTALAPTPTTTATTTTSTTPALTQPAGAPSTDTSTSTLTTPALTTTTPGPTTTTALPDPNHTLWPEELQKLLATPGAPTYDGLVVVVRKHTIVNHAGMVRRFVQAVARGYRAARKDPITATQNLIGAVPALAKHQAFTLATVRAALPSVFPSGARVWGWQREAQWNELGQWMSNHGLISTENAIIDASTNELLQGQGV